MSQEAKETAAPADPMEELRRKAERYGAGYAAFSEVLSGPGVNWLVFGAKVVIAVISIYAIGSAVLVGVGG